jgi:hypothetical protein
MVAFTVLRRLRIDSIKDMRGGSLKRELVMARKIH